MMIKKDIQDTKEQKESNFFVYETNVFANKTQTPMNRVYELGEAKIANMEFHLTTKLNLFTDENNR